MRKSLVTTVAAACWFAASIHASTNVFNFDSNPSGILNVIAVGGGGTWYPTNGSTLEPGVVDQSTNGFLAISDAGNSQRATIIFDDFDSGYVVAGFSFSMEVRVGGGTDMPADGFSINYARANDPVILNADGNGFAASPTGEGNLPEEGTQTGLSICFDEWFSGGGDVIGLTIRVDNTIVTNVPMPTLNGTCTDPTSLQTGPNTGGTEALCWPPLAVELTTNGLLNVSYKNTVFLANFPVPFAPSPGRLILAGRTGGSNADHHVDDIHIVTVPADKPLIVLLPTEVNANGFRYQIIDSGTTSPDTNTITVQLDGVAVTPTSVTRDPPTTYVTYQNPGLI